MEASTHPAPWSGLVLVDDLMFASQIQGLARTTDFQLQWVRTIASAITQAVATQPVVIVLDVNFVGAAIGDLVVSLKATNQVKPTLIGFGSHVDAASLHRAREAGCDIVLPRSKLVQELAAILRGLVERPSK